MAHGHGGNGGHDHDHDHGHGGRRSLLFSLALTGGFMLVEGVGGWLTNSLALFSDAGHMLTDTAALGLSFIALRMGELPPSRTKTFGYRRFEILAGFLNGLTLWAIVVLLVREAVARLMTPTPVQGRGMMLVAGVGLLVNLASLGLLSAHKDENLNLRGAFLHVLADSLGSVAALGAGIVILLTGWYPADPLASLGICLLILWSSWGLVKDSLHILLEGVPAHLDYAEVEQVLLAHEGVCCLYDLHIWSITGGHEALSAHVVVPDGYGRQKELLREIVISLRERFGIEHATLQLEESHDLRDEFLNGRSHAVCKLPGQEGFACRIPAAARLTEVSSFSEYPPAD
ncbi:MAG: cation transporter [Deltaproteobacteria bacterium]|nr:cation transporter [Deltaproteobacteria bacterium]